MKKISEETQAKVEALLSALSSEGELDDIISALIEVDKKQDAAKQAEYEKAKLNEQQAVRVGYYALTVVGTGCVEDATHIFYNSGRAEQALRAFVHEGYTVTIKEEKRIDELTTEQIQNLQEKGAEVIYIHNYNVEKLASCTAMVNPVITGRY